MNKGQVGIVVVLVGVVVFTLGMSTAARVTTDVRLAARTEEGAKALFAAEAALEIAMNTSDPATIPATFSSVTNCNVGGTPPPFFWRDQSPGATACANVKATLRPGSASEYSVGAMSQGSARTIWLLNNVNTGSINLTGSGYDGNFRIRWTTITSNTEVEIIVLYKPDPIKVPGVEVAVARRLITGSGTTFTVNTSDTSLFPASTGFSKSYLARIKPIRGAIRDVVVDSWAGSFPVQEYELESVGWTSTNQVRKKVIGRRLVGEIPPFFDYVIANSGGPLNKTN